MPAKGRAAADAARPEERSRKGKLPEVAQALPPGDLNLLLDGLRLRGMNGPSGLLRMGGWKRHRYGKDVAGHVRMALNLAGARPLASCQNEPKCLSVLVVHKGVFDEDSLHASVKPLLDALRPVKGCVAGDPGLPGLLKDDSPDWLTLEVRQAKGPYAVFVRAWSSSLAVAFSGKRVEV